MERLLGGDLPPGGKCDLETPAALAGVTRTGFYAKKHRDGSMRRGPYPSEKDPTAGREAAQFRRGGPGHQEAGDE
jgi:hypothetical protein